MEELEPNILIDFQQTPKQNKKNKKDLILIILMILSLAVGYLAGIGSSFKLNNSASGENNSKLNQVYEILDKNWVSTDESLGSLETLAIKGIINNINDRHTQYYTFEEAQQFSGSLDGEYEGIGVTFQKVDTGILVTRAGDGTPAKKAGIQEGDIITHVNGVDISKKINDEIVSMVKGPAGTSVELTVQRGSSSHKMTVIRGKVDSTCYYEVREEQGVKFGYLNIVQFGTGTASEVKNALIYFQEQKIQNIVIDVRDNPGGYLTSVESILEPFMAADSLLFQIQTKDENITEYKAKSSEDFVFSKGIVLMNENSASAAEILAAALSENEGYTLVGTTTYGKGTAQTQQTLPDLSVLKYTYARWLTPSGNCINEVGIKPDVFVENIDLSEISDFKVEEDLQYDQVGEKVVMMQNMLKALKYNVDRTDGYFSLKTQEALKQFEKDNQLTVDGKLTAQDKDVLVSKLVQYANAKENDYQYKKAVELLK